MTVPTVPLDVSRPIGIANRRENRRSSGELGLSLGDEYPSWFGESEFRRRDVPFDEDPLTCRPSSYDSRRAVDVLESNGGVSRLSVDRSSGERMLSISGLRDESMLMEDMEWAMEWDDGMDDELLTSKLARGRGGGVLVAGEC